MHRNAQQYSACRRRGFSLLELIVVLTLISIISGALAPMFGASIGSVQFRNARNDLIALLQFTQEIAVRDSREYRLYLDKNESAYWVEQLIEKNGATKTFAPVTAAYGQRKQLPPYVELTQIKARKDRRGRELFIGCYPNGASDEAQLTLTDKRSRGRKVRIDVTGPLGRVVVSKERR